MLKTLCAMLITILAAASAQAQTRINGIPALKFRVAATVNMAGELASKSRVTERIAIFRQTYLSHIDRNSDSTRVMYEVTRDLIQEESILKTKRFSASKDADERRRLSSDIKLINESLRIYDFAPGASQSRSSGRVQ